MRFVIVAVVLLIAACIALAATATRYYVRDKVSGSSVFWSADRCIVVVGVDRYGLHTTLAGSLIESVRARLNVAGSRPDDRSSAVILFTVTSAGVDAKRAPLPYSDFEVMDGSLYSRLGGYQRSLWRWTGATFEKATVDQEAALASAHAPIDFEHRNGWSKRFDPFHRGARSEVPIFVGGRSASLIFEYDGTARYTLTLSDGSDRQVLIGIDESPRSVDASSYVALIRSGPEMEQTSSIPVH